MLFFRWAWRGYSIALSEGLGTFVCMIRFDSVTKIYGVGTAGATTAVDNLTLEAPTGRITVLVGPSGCGKTTTLRMVNRMIIPTSGTISIDGRDTASLDVAELRRSIGYVIQHAGLFPHRTVLDNVTTVPRLLGVDKRTARARGMELIERVGLEPALARRYPAQLSGGQQQRVGVARALAADPPVMLMDEPFGAVDPIGRRNLQQEFWRIQRALGTTVMLVTHDIDEAVRLGDRIAVFSRGGHLEQVADAVTLLARPAAGMVSDFVGTGRTVRLLSITELAREDLEPASSSAAGPDGGALGSTPDGTPLRLGSRLDEAMAALVVAGPAGVAVLDGDGRAAGRLTAAGLLAALRRVAVGTSTSTDTDAETDTVASVDAG